MHLFQPDTGARLKSFFRRRDVIFRRVFDLDLQCGTLSFLLQVNEDKSFIKAESIHYDHILMAKGA